MCTCFEFLARLLIRSPVTRCSVSFTLMGCGRSVPVQPHPTSGINPAPVTSAVTSPPPGRSSPVGKHLQVTTPKTAAPVSGFPGRKWSLLMDWTGWNKQDQFGWPQPDVSDIVAANERSKLSCLERPHDYQVAISFPGADFDKGSESHQSAPITDHTGQVLGASGTELAESLRHWLVDGWLDGDEQKGLSHVFVCSKNLRYCPGSVKAKHFRHYNVNKAQDDSVAILNENWAMYMRESFLEARVVVLVINEDWLDSIPCNQEFEALITRKHAFSGSSRRDVMIFMDITDERFNERWGAKLPQFKAGLAFEAGKYFDVLQFTYNQQASVAAKIKVQQEFVAAVARYGTKHPRVPDLEYKDLTVDAKEVNWPNWMYYTQLEGTGGWETLIEVQPPHDGFNTKFEADENVEPLAKEIPSRRFRLRVMGVSGDTFNEGYKFMCSPLVFNNKATGANIVAEGKGYWRTAGERMGTLGFSHWCGPKQYSWVEWLVPEDQPPVVLKSVDVRVNARCWVLEAMPDSVWPSHGESIKDYTFLGFNESTTVNVSTASKALKWVVLHEVAEGQPAAADGGMMQLPATAPACKAFRIRFTGAAAADQISAAVTMKANFPEGLYPIGGGQASGSGGNCSMEDAPPEFAFDGSDQTRWVDIDGGGIGNKATLVYEHTSAVEVLEYSITSQMYALSSYHSHLNGTPRDWELKAHLEGSDEWVVVDKRFQTYFTNHTETKRFSVTHPVAASRYRLEFTAVAAGCASRSIQVGEVILYARYPARAVELQQHQLVVLPSAYNSLVGPEAARAAGWGLAPEWGVAWPNPSRLEVRIPTNPEGLGVVHGGQLGWVLGEGRVSNWYDHPTEILVAPKWREDPGEGLETRAMLVVRPRKEPMDHVDHVHTVSFRQEYPGGEAELVYTHTRPFVLKAYSMRSADNYGRGDPRTWLLQAEVQAGDWLSLHSVINFNFPDRSAPLRFYLPDNTQQATRYRLVVLEMNAMVALLHFQDLLFYKQLSGDADLDADAIPLPHKEAAHVSLRLKPREAAGGQVQAVAYGIAGAAGAAASAWVLEGFTSEY